ncbi:Receptor family ligand binding region [Candidatus Izimaplasma bacterium HR1]|jgi:ABC-type branched-subunit amino acid transport system substrate-binding protein|uniref:ABC transporter substrate-binding protein n=1 Tax=Candidatus Izimoplasma sp. HR1 TaxID=1541959 RepID=UPI0004F77AD0|nr:Receptor family ligand binding region [Candidatus Izimaplasma bacterium HR1]
MKKVLLLVLVMVFAFSLSGCQKASQGVTDTTVTVGNTAPVSGALAFVGLPFNQGMQAYFDMVNDDGGVAGRTIEFINHDDGFDAATGLTYTEELVEDDQVFALVGHFGTPTVGATIDYVREQGIPQVYFATGISALFNEEATDNDRSSFPVQPIYDAEGQVMVARAVGNFGAAKIGVIYTNDDAGNGILNGVRIQATTEDVTLVEAQVAADATDMSSAALTLINAEVDFIIVAANQVPASIAIKALAAGGSDVDCIVSYVNAAASFIGLISAELANFDVYASAWINIFNADGTLSDGYNMFVTEVSKIDPALAANPYAMAGWVAAAFFVEGLERVGEGTLNWDNFIDAMEESPVLNPLGGTVDYADGRRAGTQSMSLLKATYTPADGDTPAVALFVANQPMETIEEILAD